MQNLWPKLLLIFSLSGLSALDSAKATMRLGSTFGLGQAQLVSKGATFDEGPASMSVFAENVFHSRLALGADHTRTVQMDDGELSTAVALTGLTARWFPLVPMPRFRDETGSPGKVHFIQSHWAPFIRGSFGFSQTSIRAKTFDQLGKGTSVGIYTGFDAGVEYILFGQVGATAQLGYSLNLIGDGRLQMLSGTLGMYIYF